MSSLRRALPQVQFVATSHDPLCLRGMDDGEVFVLQRDENNRVQILDDLPSIRGMRTEQLLTSDYFGLSSTSDPEMEIGVAHFAQQASRRPLDGMSVGSPTDSAERLISRLVIGDTAKEQVIQAALERYLDERDRPAGGLRTDVRKEAVDAVLKALQNPNPDNSEKL